MATDHFFLIGPMGAGKSTVGKQLAKALNRPFFDIDDEIVEACGADIQWIFDVEGEEGFRARETSMLKKLIAEDASSIIATGGGIVMRKDNCSAIVTSGTVIYLMASKAQLYERTKRDKKRPLLQVQDRSAVIDKLFDERHPVYQSIADLVVTSGASQSYTVVNDVLNQLAQKTIIELP
jgi:shikimate kinase